MAQTDRETPPKAVAFWVCSLPVGREEVEQRAQAMYDAPAAEQGLEQMRQKVTDRHRRSACRSLRDADHELDGVSERVVRAG